MIPNGWQNISLGKIIRLGSGSTKPDDLEKTPSELKKIPVFGGNGITGYTSSSITDGENIIIGRVGEYCGSVHYVNEPCWVTDNALMTREFLSSGSPKFLSYLLEYLNLGKLRNKGGQPLISQQPIYSIHINYPEKIEQIAIASIIEKWDRSIELTARLIATKQEQRKWLMQQLLTGNRRLPGFAGEWRKTHIGDILKEVKRPVKWDENHLYQLISVRRRSEGLFQREHLYGSQIKTKKMNLAKTGDFLISKMQIVHGASGLVTDEFDGMHISDSYIALRSSTPKIFDINFFNWLSKLPLMYQHALFSSYGVHIEKMTFNLKDYLARHIKIPPTIDEQQAIVKVLITSDHEINLLRTQLDALRDQKKGLMQQLLTGKVRVKI